MGTSRRPRRFTARRSHGGAGSFRARFVLTALVSVVVLVAVAGVVIKVAPPSATQAPPTLAANTLRAGSSAFDSGEPQLLVLNIVLLAASLRA